MNTENDKDGIADGADAPSAPRFKTLEIDTTYYQSLLDAPGHTEAEKEAFIRALWQVVCAFVDLGFQLNPVQNSGGEVARVDSLPDILATDMVELGNTLNAIAGPAARPFAARDERIP